MKLDVNQIVKARDGEDYCQAKRDSHGRVYLEDGVTAKHLHTFAGADAPLMVPQKLGQIINQALDTPDEKATPEERRKRWWLAAAIEEAMQSGTAFEFGSDEGTRIKAAADLVTNNNLVLARIHEAVKRAEKGDKPAKATNGAAEHAAA